VVLVVEEADQVVDLILDRVVQTRGPGSKGLQVWEIGKKLSD
jgi:hypothetical protein